MQGFSLKMLKHLVLDEADRLLNMDFEQEIDQILKVGALPLQHHSMRLHMCCLLWRMSASRWLL